MVKKIAKLGFINILLYISPLVAENNTAEPLNTLHWDMIIEKFDTKQLLCSTNNIDINTFNYALAPNISTFMLPSNIGKKEKTEIELKMSKYQDGWPTPSLLTAQIDSNILTIDTNTITKGFYRLSTISGKNNTTPQKKRFLRYFGGRLEKRYFSFLSQAKTRYRNESRY